MVTLHLAESLNLSLDERKLLAEACVEVSAGRTPVIINVSIPGTDHAVELVRHAENIGADSVMSNAPYHWKPPAEGLYEHFSEIMLATNLPFFVCNSPLIMAGIGISPEILTRLIKWFPHFIDIKDASHNWEVVLELGRATRTLKPDFGLFVGTEWIIPTIAALEVIQCIKPGTTCRTAP